MSSYLLVSCISVPVLAGTVLIRLRFIPTPLLAKKLNNETIKQHNDSDDDGKI